MLNYTEKVLEWTSPADRLNQLFFNEDPDHEHEGDELDEYFEDGTFSFFFFFFFFFFTM